MFEIFRNLFINKILIVVTIIFIQVRWKVLLPVEIIEMKHLIG
jgi:hypothetical protein